MNLTDKRFHNVDEARKWFEAQRWPNGPYCPHCGNSDSEKITGLHGKAHRPGVYQCNECREQFTVTVGTVMERSKIPLNKWLMAMHLMAASKKGYSAHQLHRTLEITYQSAWFLAHRIREAMREAELAPMGGSGSVIEADETYYGKLETPRKRNKHLPPPTKRGHSGGAAKRAILGLVERGGKIKTFHIEAATAGSSVYALAQKAWAVIHSLSTGYPQKPRCGWNTAGIRFMAKFVPEKGTEATTNRLRC